MAIRNDVPESSRSPSGWHCVTWCGSQVSTIKQHMTFSTFLSKYNKTTERRRASSLPKWKTSEKTKLIFLVRCFFFAVVEVVAVLVLLRRRRFHPSWTWRYKRIRTGEKSRRKTKQKTKQKNKKTKQRIWERESSLSGRHPHNCTSRPRPSHHTRLHGNLLIIHRRGGAAAAQRGIHTDSTGLQSPSRVSYRAAISLAKKAIGKSENIQGEKRLTDWQAKKKGKHENKNLQNTDWKQMNS